MNNVQEKRHVQKYPNNQAAALRLKNFAEELAEDMSSGVTPVSQQSMGMTDSLFAIEAIVQSLHHRALKAMTPEKKKLLRRQVSKAMFLSTVEQDGGLYTSAETAKLLGFSKVTIKAKKDAHKLLALNIDGEFCYPVFQFTGDADNSEDGVLRELPQLLALLQDVSDRMQYSFFMEERNTPLNGLKPAGRTYTIAGLLNEKPDADLMAEIYRLARLYGKQDAA
ncbi:hypothetical protein [Pantoea sp. GM01]|uniref:hypothetical protein n=1 Tax=Pantoea sp. GM01 TaxID=1144320 RepID=UPI000270F0B4|nr:hypothetical protein [Pantoea sp. GM01]EJL93197.1 hypothetical protein PMI17_00466 [Pantoea sp. GM01]